jgi:hypothetical protein
VQKYALLLTDTRTEKKELQTKLDEAQKEVKAWISRFYLTIIISLVLIIL